MEQVEKRKRWRAGRERTAAAIELFFRCVPFSCFFFLSPIQNSKPSLSSSRRPSRSPPRARHCKIEHSACARAKGNEFGGLASARSARGIGACVAPVRACLGDGEKERLPSSLSSLSARLLNPRVSLNPPPLTRARARALEAPALPTLARGNLCESCHLSLSLLSAVTVFSAAGRRRAKEGPPPPPPASKPNSHTKPSLFLSPSIPQQPLRHQEHRTLDAVIP